MSDHRGWLWTLLSSVWTAGHSSQKNLLFLITYTEEWIIKASAANGSELLKAAQSSGPALAKLLTWLENAALRDVFSLPELLNPPRAAFRFGITGPPGAGKSTIVSRLIARLRRENLRVGVLAVDPSSPFSRGAILGDRIRYSEHFLDPSVFIRSLATRGSLGGLSSGAFLMARAFDVCGFDVTLIETVGVGQSELDVLHVADQIAVVLVPESGDSVQAMKAGLMEIADLFVVNKGDRPGADSLVREIEASIHDGESSRRPSVIKAVATNGSGIEEIAQKILEARKEDVLKKRNQPERLREEARALLRRQWENDIETRLQTVHDLKTFRNLF